REGIAFFKQVGWPIVIAQLAMNLALTHIIAGELTTAEEVIASTRRIAEEGGFSYIIKGLENLRPMVLLEKREFADAERELTVVQQSDIPVQMKPWFYRNQAILLHYTGNPEQSRVARQEMLGVLNVNGHGMYAPECHLASAFLEWREGRADTAFASAERALILSQEA
ncbi:unnamed protein product, partial [Phaeothamnion confervicola]